MDELETIAHSLSIIEGLLKRGEEEISVLKKDMEDCLRGIKNVRREILEHRSFQQEARGEMHGEE